MNKEFLGGYLFNRKHFHATNSVISCIAWGNKDSDTSTLTLEAADIIDNEYTVIKNIKINKVSNAFECWFDRRKLVSDINTSVWCEGDGTETLGRKCDGHSIFNDDILAYVRPVGYDMGPLNRYLTRQIHYNARGFYLRKDNYLEKLPLWVAKMFTPDGWYETNIYATTSDGGDAYTKDKVFLKSCMIYTCLSNQNKCLSFTGSDGRYYRNELCFDTTNGDTVASADIATMALDAESKKLMALWENILTEAKKTANYNPKLTYGVYQITKELNTSHEEGIGTSKKTVYDYPILNGYLTTLRDMLKAYYKSHITDKMFKYELLK